MNVWAVQLWDILRTSLTERYFLHDIYPLLLFPKSNERMKHVCSAFEAWISTRRPSAYRALERILFRPSGPNRFRFHSIEESTTEQPHRKHGRQQSTIEHGRVGRSQHNSQVLDRNKQAAIGGHGVCEQRANIPSQGWGSNTRFSRSFAGVYELEAAGAMAHSRVVIVLRAIQ